MKPEPHFNGPDYDPNYDFERLANQHERVKQAMLDKKWRTLDEISQITGDPPASISAQLRHLRKERFGSWVIEKQARGEREDGLFEYRMLPPTGEKVERKKRRNQIEELKNQLAERDQQIIKLKRLLVDMREELHRSE